jgi:hypothetical protein
MVSEIANLDIPSISEKGSALLAAINSYISTNPDHLYPVSMIIGVGKNKNTHTYQAKLTQEATDELRTAMIESLEYYGNYELITYEYANPPNATQAICTDIHFELIDQLYTYFSDLATLELFTGDKATNCPPKYMALHTEVDSHQILFIEKLSQNNYLTAKKKIFSLFGTELHLLKKELLYFEKEFTAIVIDSVIYFKNLTYLQRICGIGEKLKQEALTTANQIADALPIANFDKMREDIVKSLPMIMKLKSISQKMLEDADYTKSILNSAAIFQFLDHHPEFDVPTVDTEKGRQLEYVTHPQKRYTILKLLDDDYLSSPITSASYSANSKQRP